MTTSIVDETPPQKTGPRSITPKDVVRRIGDTNERAIRYVLKPDPKLARLSRKVREALLPELPPVTAGALLGPAALARHLIASAATGRYRDLFALWELFRERPEECKPVLAERQHALRKAQRALEIAVRLGLSGHAQRVAEDIAAAEGLIWQWLREVVMADLASVGRRPAVASALLRREPDLAVPLPERPSESWLAEAVAARRREPLAPAVEAVVAANVARLPATIATLTLAAAEYPAHVPGLVDRIDLASPEIGALVAWVRDHGHVDRLRSRLQEAVDAAADHDRAGALALWHEWRDRGLEVPLPDALRKPTLDGLDLGRPESAVLIAQLRADGAELDPQAALEGAATRNRQLAEKAYEAFVCAGLEVQLPLALEDNPIVKEGTRCPACSAWTWVRPGHERRCPRRAPAA